MSVTVVKFAPVWSREYVVAHIDIHVWPGAPAEHIARAIVGRARSALRCHSIRIQRVYQSDAQWTKRRATLHPPL